MRFRYFVLLLTVFIGFVVNAQRIELERSCFNTDGDEYGVRQLNGQLVVVSSPVINDKKSGQTSENEYSDLFQINDCKLSIWMLPSAQFEKAINVNSMLNDGPPSVSDSLIFFTVNFSAGPFARLGIFYSRKLKQGWSEVIPFELNSTEFNVTHPAYDAKRDLLYFASDATGNMDIFAVKFNNNNPKKVVLPNLNTTSNDFFPYAFENKLYFTSNRPGGLGGLDLYAYADGKVEHLPEPYNSAFDDLAISWVDTTKGYFSTNRNTNQKNDDIYSFTIIPDEPVVDTIIAQETTMSLEEIEWREKIVWINDSLGRLRNFILTSNENKALLGLMDRALKNINVKIPQDINEYKLPELKHLYGLLETTLISLINSLKKEQEPTVATNTTDIQALNELIKSSKVEQIQFKFNSSIIPDEFKELISGVAVLMKTDARIKIQVGGHTDNVGKKEYNLSLSKLRAESVKNYLISKGIESNRISISYFGMDKPIADNATEQGRYLNRRVEMKLEIQ